MKSVSRAAAVLSAMLVLACERKIADYPIPANATTTKSGVRYITLRTGTAESALDGELYGVNSVLISHTKRGCDHPCEQRDMMPRSELKDDRWRDLILSMHEGETRRMWIVEKPNEEPRVYDVTLASVDRLGSDGQAVVDTRS